MKANDYKDSLILCLYVNNVTFIGINPKMISDFKRIMMKEFVMTDLRLISYFLGIEVILGDDEIFIHKINMSLNL